MQTSLDDVQQYLKGGVGPRPKKKHYSLVQFQMKTGIFFMNDVKKNDSKFQKKV